MNTSYWQQQTDQPLFPNLLWSRPETRQGAGKLLIIGGQAQEFIHVAESYAAAEKAGAGAIRVMMPTSTSKITRHLPNIEYAASNNSGSFSRQALAEIIDVSLWADGVLLAGDLGRNSETSLLLEDLLEKYPGRIIISKEALGSFSLKSEGLFNNEKAILCIEFDDLRKFGIDLHLDKPITTSISNQDLAEIFHQLGKDYPVSLIVKTREFAWSSSDGRVASTKLRKDLSITELASQTAVWSIQQPTKIFEAITTAAYC